MEDCKMVTQRQAQGDGDIPGGRSRWGWRGGQEQCVWGAACAGSLGRPVKEVVRARGLSRDPREVRVLLRHSRPGRRPRGLRSLP